MHHHFHSKPHTGATSLLEIDSTYWELWLLKTSYKWPPKLTKRSDPREKSRLINFIFEFGQIKGKGKLKAIKACKGRTVILLLSLLFSGFSQCNISYRFQFIAIASSRHGKSQNDSFFSYFFSEIPFCILPRKNTSSFLGFDLLRVVQTTSFWSILLPKGVPKEARNSQKLLV